MLGTFSLLLKAATLLSELAASSTVCMIFNILREQNIVPGVLILLGNLIASPFIQTFILSRKIITLEYPLCIQHYFRH